MADVPDPMKSLGLAPEFLAQRRVRFFPEADRTVIQSMRCGVLFIMAFWSGPARLAFTDLKQVLTKLDLLGRLELVVVDTDGSPDLSYRLLEFGHAPGGWGETAWVEGGQIVSVVFWPDMKTFESHTANLLTKCS